MLTERNRLLDAQELARLKAQLFEEETAMKAELIPIVRRIQEILHEPPTPTNAPRIG